MHAVVEVEGAHARMLPDGTSDPRRGATITSHDHAMELPGADGHRRGLMRIRSMSFGLAALLWVGGCGGAPPRPSAPEFDVTAAYQLDSFRIGDPLASVVTRGSFARPPCSDERADNRRVVVWTGIHVEDCEGAVFPESTAVALLYRGEREAARIEALLWTGGNYFAGRSNFPGRVGMTPAQLEAVLGPPERSFPVEDDGFRMIIQQHGPTVFSLLDGDIIFGFAVGHMPQSPESREWSMLLAMAVRASPTRGPDQDGDGLIDRRDACPSEAGSFDERGCPERRAAAGGDRPSDDEADDDNDDIADDEDECLDAAEDLDGFEDYDGCPDPDNDGDRVNDTQDRCPSEAEDRDGFQDGDGCPENDNDGDGIADASDRCPTESERRNGIEDTDGCPDEDPVPVPLQVQIQTTLAGGGMTTPVIGMWPVGGRTIGLAVIGDRVLWAHEGEVGVVATLDAALVAEGVVTATLRRDGSVLLRVERVGNDPRDPGVQHLMLLAGSNPPAVIERWSGTLRERAPSWAR
jgi:hypothetical protein